MNTLSGSPKKRLAYFDLRPKNKKAPNSQLFCRNAAFLWNCISRKQNHLISTFNTKIPYYFEYFKYMATTFSVTGLRHSYKQLWEGSIFSLAFVRFNTTLLLLHPSQHQNLSVFPFQRILLTWSVPSVSKLLICFLFCFLDLLILLCSVPFVLLLCAVSLQAQFLLLSRTAHMQVSKPLHRATTTTLTAIVSQSLWMGPA